MITASSFQKARLLMPFHSHPSGSPLLYTSNLAPFPSIDATQTISSPVNSTSEYKYYGSSFYVQNGVNSYLIIPRYNGLDIGTTADFTIACWVRLYTGTLPTYGCLVSSNISSYTTGAVALMIGSSRVPRLVGSGKTERSSGTAITAGVWTHVAVTRASNTLRWFIDGALVSTVSDSQDWVFDYTGTLIARNGWDGANAPLPGHFNDLLFVIGEALWTSAFTPSSLMGYISNSGTTSIKDDTNADAIRTIKAFPRVASPTRVFHSVSDSNGLYSLFVPKIACDVIFEDDTSGSEYSDILVSRVIPT